MNYLDQPLARIENSGAVHYYHADVLGSIVALTNSSGGVTTRYNYSPFGVTEVTGTDAVGLSQPFRFTGREWDAETGMYYYRARYYAPEMGRFISEDPIRFASGEVNWYAYVGNNPVNMVDPMGLIGIMDEATQSANMYYPPSTQHNGIGDAYRHCLASCLMTYDYGETIAATAGWANEKKGDWTHNQEKGEREMDDYNNKTGRLCGKNVKDRADCFTGCKSLADNGSLKTYEAGSTDGYWY